MISGIFTGIDKLQKGLDASWLRNEVISNNIANVDTPDFKRSSVAFEEYYKAALDGSTTAFHNKKTRAKHIDFGMPASEGAQVIKDSATTMRMDGNNVDIDKEMTDLARNILYYNTLTRKVTGEITQLRTAIRDGR